MKRLDEQYNTQPKNNTGAVIRVNAFEDNNKIINENLDDLTKDSVANVSSLSDENHVVFENKNGDVIKDLDLSKLAGGDSQGLFTWKPKAETLLAEVEFKTFSTINNVRGLTPIPENAEISILYDSETIIFPPVIKAKFGDAPGQTVYGTLDESIPENIVYMSSGKNLEKLYWDNERAILKTDLQKSPSELKFGDDGLYVSIDYGTTWQKLATSNNER